MEKFNLDDYKGYVKCVMHCDTKEKAKVLCSFLHKSGHKWDSGESCEKETKWEEYEEDTVYYFNNGEYVSVGWAKNDGCVLEFDDFNWNDMEEKTMKFNVGDKQS